MMKKILICLIITSIIPLFCACSKKEEEVLRPVEYVPAQSSKSIKNKAFSGYLKSATLTNLSFQIEGYLERIYPSEGAKVKSGQLLAKLDSPLYQIQVQEAQYNLADILVQYQNARNYYQRIKQLNEMGGISDNDTDNAKTKMESVNYQIQVAREKLNYAKERLNYSNLYAPQDGIVLTRVASEKQYVKPGDTIIEFQGIKDIDVYISVSQNYINEIYLNQNAKVRVDAIKDKIFDTKVKEISGTSLGGISYLVKLRPILQSEELKDGMSANAVFEIKEEEKSFIKIPINSILKEGDDNFAYTIEERKENKGIIKKNKVTLGALQGDYIEVISGIEEGQYVVSKGVEEVQEGQKVVFNENN